MPIALRASLLSLSTAIVSFGWSVTACAQDEFGQGLKRVQAGDEVTAPLVHHAASPVPQFDPASFPSQLFWLALSFAFLYLLMSRLVLPRIGQVVDARAAQIANDLAQAHRDRQLAGELLAAHETQLVQTRTSAQATVAQAQADAAQTLSAELARQNMRLAAHLNDAEARLAANHAAALGELAPGAAQATQAIVTRLTGRTVDMMRAEAEVTKALQMRDAA